MAVGRRCRSRRRCRGREPPSPPLPGSPPPGPVPGPSGGIDRRSTGIRGDRPGGGASSASESSSGPAQSASARSVLAVARRRRGGWSTRGVVPSGGRSSPPGRLTSTPALPESSRSLPRARRADHDHEGRRRQARSSVENSVSSLKNPAGYRPCRPSTNALAMPCSGAHQTLLVRILPFNVQSGVATVPETVWIDACVRSHLTLAKQSATARLLLEGWLPARYAAAAGRDPEPWTTASPSTSDRSGIRAKGEEALGRPRRGAPGQPGFQPGALACPRGGRAGGAGPAQRHERRGRARRGRPRAARAPASLAVRRGSRRSRTAWTSWATTSPACGLATAPQRRRARLRQAAPAAARPLDLLVARAASPRGAAASRPGRSRPQPQGGGPASSAAAVPRSTARAPARAIARCRASVGLRVVVEVGAGDGHARDFARLAQGRCERGVAFAAPAEPLASGGIAASATRSAPASRRGSRARQVPSRTPARRRARRAPYSTIATLGPPMPVDWIVSCRLRAWPPCSPIARARGWPCAGPSSRSCARASARPGSPGSRAIGAIAAVGRR